MKINLSGIPSVSEWNSLDPDQAQYFVRPDLDPNSLQRLSADKKISLIGVASIMQYTHMHNRINNTQGISPIVFPEFR